MQSLKCLHPHCTGKNIYIYLSCKIILEMCRVNVGLKCFFLFRFLCCSACVES